jgi:hypothetical protein
VTGAVLMAVLSIGTANSMRHAQVATRYIDTNTRHQAAVALMSRCGPGDSRHDAGDARAERESDDAPTARRVAGFTVA